MFLYNATSVFGGSRSTNIKQPASISSERRARRQRRLNACDAAKLIPARDDQVTYKSGKFSAMGGKSKSRL
jgi:hypothetical protein